MTRFLTALLLVAFASAQPALHLKTRRIEVRAGLAVDELHSPRPSAPGHLIVQFETPPSPAAIAELKNRNVRILADVPENGLLISLNRRIPVRDLKIRYAAPIEPQDKMSPIAASGFTIVEFHPDVDLNTGRAIVLAAGIELRENPDLHPHHLLVRASIAKLEELARQDEVAYIFPASDALVSGRPTRPCAGALTSNGSVVQSIPTFGSGWDGSGLGSATIGYVFSKVTAQLDPSAAEGEIRRAMAEWSKPVKVAWEPGSSATAVRTVNILFATGEHGDGFPFTDKHILAHTFYPAPPNPEPIAGDMHFNDAETWHIGADMDLFSLALHELGHSLGLGHADNPNAVMYPYYKMVTTLSPLDVAAIQTLYAAQTTTSPTPTVLTLTVNPPAPTTTAVAIAISGSVSGGSGKIAVTWSTDRGASGSAQGSSSWTIPPIPLVTGANRITVVASDSATKVSQAFSVSREFTSTPPGPTGPPALVIASPAATSVSTTAASIPFSGTAASSAGIASVTWSTNTGASGTASGAAQWTATIPLLVGANTVTIRASDLSGNACWRTVVVTRR